MRRAVCLCALLSGLLAASPALAQEQTFQIRGGFGHNIQQRRPQLATPLVTWDVTVRQDGKYFWSGPLTISLDNQIDEVGLTQGADCVMVIVAFAGEVAAPAGLIQGDYRYQGAMVTIGLRADNVGGTVPRHSFTMRLSRGEPTADAKPVDGDRCEANPWQSYAFDWTSQFTMPDGPVYRIAGPRGFSVEFRRHSDD